MTLLQEIIERLDYLEEKLRASEGDSGPLGSSKILHIALAKYFSEDELKDVAFVLGIDWDDLAAETLTGKARELCLLTNREGRLIEVVNLAEKLRPQVDWKQWHKK